MAQPPRQNRRRSERIRLAKPLVCRLGTEGVVLIDISNHGARVEHYSRFERGAEKTLRIRWNNVEIAMPSTVVSCKVDRFIPGESGLTVYRSGLRFLDEKGAEFEKVRKMTTAFVTGTLVEQVANAKGFYTPAKKDMPIFRKGALTTQGFDVGSTSSDDHLLPQKELARRVGFVRYSFERGSWGQKWTLDPHQPVEGFTVSANEPWEQVQSLCDLYQKSDPEGRAFIRLLAEASVESELGQSRENQPTQS
ncbi:MAG TPA: PilZ domain-containing protein [Thermoanaerobaculia bacterium]|nr:PilZ domain-containing protein [Thermoanaerobaculia bacterium]